MLTVVWSELNINEIKKSRGLHQLTNNFKLVGYCLPRSSEDVRNNLNYITDDTPLTTKDKYEEKKTKLIMV